MRVFVLCTGRCGSLTLARACGHISNYTSGHETRSRLYSRRLDYPDGHIEVDNRLSWMLGTLDRLYGDDAVYVHLQRTYNDVMTSYALRTDSASGIVPAFAHGIIQQPRGSTDYEKSTRLMLDTVRDNIAMFLRDKTHVIRMRIERPHAAFDRLWRLVGAEGDRQAAHEELDYRHNARRTRT